MALDVNKIDLSVLADQLHNYECKWIAISEDNKIVSSGMTYAEVLEKVPNPEDVVLFKVPPLEYALVS